MNVFITGGTKGIGKGMVIEFQKRDCKVFYTGTTENSVQSSGLLELENTKGYVSNVTNREETKLALQKALEYMGSIDIWINNAGVNQPYKDVSDLSDDDISHVIDVNITGMINATAVALNYFKEQGQGVVYNMEGLGSNNMIFPKTVIYASSKHLLTFFTKGINKELKDYDQIMVGTLSPGMVFTDLLKKVGNTDGDKIMNILGSKVEQVTPYLVKKMLQGKKNIYYLSRSRMMWRFISYPFRKK